uniref:BolA protein 1 n=1 Tax=Echinococcus granulosus TaxID=6210 RepID=A0A068WZR5_ECHGR|nr:bolA protein 1 [Echinococcus granulosus]
MQMQSWPLFQRSCILTSRFACSKTGPIQTVIKEKLTALFKPTYLDVINESHHHASNIGHESHFRISIVSKDFENIGDVMRHRLIKKALQHEFDAGLHAISILAKSPSEEMREHRSVPCIGKSKEINLDE